MGFFRKFLEESDADVNTLQSTLSRTLGPDLKKLGMSAGSRGTGIVAIGDASSKDVQKVVNNMLDKHNMAVLAKGKMSSEMMADYRGAMLSVVETGTGTKVLITK